MLTTRKPGRYQRDSVGARRGATEQHSARIDRKPNEHNQPGFAQQISNLGASFSFLFRLLLDFHDPRRSDFLACTIADGRPAVFSNFVVFSGSYYSCRLILSERSFIPEKRGRFTRGAADPKAEPGAGPAELPRLQAEDHRWRNKHHMAVLP